MQQHLRLLCIVMCFCLPVWANATDKLFGYKAIAEQILAVWHSFAIVCALFIIYQISLGKPQASSLLRLNKQSIDALVPQVLLIKCKSAFWLLEGNVRSYRLDLASQLPEISTEDAMLEYARDFLQGFNAKRNLMLNILLLLLERTWLVVSFFTLMGLIQFGWYGIALGLIVAASVFYGVSRLLNQQIKQWAFHLSAEDKAVKTLLFSSQRAASKRSRK
ncbi:hypothetical protein VQ643_13205 [Pseudomonas sp. F1_0610]|uniref:hypothetical protein n=1 Tax=Pseudomonas sp. F1_0610 TaxID=3114284 RepID=UPI0039C332CD